MRGRVLYLPNKNGDPKEMADDVLLAACATQDASSLGVLYDRYHQIVYRFLARMSGFRGPDLDDLVQTTFLQVPVSAKRFSGKSSVKTWLLGIAANVARHHIRSEVRRKRMLTSLREVPSVETDEPDVQVERQRQIAQLTEALDDLPYRIKVVFVMCDLEGVSGVEAARILKLRQGTLWRRLHEARKSLATDIKGGRK